MPYGLDINRPDSDGNHLLMNVLGGRKMDKKQLEERNRLVASILRAGGQVNHKNHEGQTAFHLFIEQAVYMQKKSKDKFKYLNIVNRELYRMFMQAGGDVSLADADGNAVTSMMQANNMDYLRV